MKDKISSRELALIKVEALIKQYPSLKDTILWPNVEGVRKAVEDSKKIALAEASNSARKNWQDNKWSYIGISIAIGIVAGVGSYIIINLLLK